MLALQGWQRFIVFPSVSQQCSWRLLLHMFCCADLCKAVQYGVVLTKISKAAYSQSFAGIESMTVEFGSSEPWLCIVLQLRCSGRLFLLPKYLFASLDPVIPFSIHIERRRRVPNNSGSLIVAEFIPIKRLSNRNQASENEKSFAVPHNYKIRTSANDGVMVGRPPKTRTAKTNPLFKQPTKNLQSHSCDVANTLPF